MSALPLIRFENVVKRFPGVVALDGVSFDVTAGTCHALCGENGAGKSTLGKILAGIHPLDSGRILLEGKEVRFQGPGDALAAGIGMVHQELSFCENMTVAENLCLGTLPARGPFLSRGEMHRRARAYLDRIGAGVDTSRAVGELSVGQRQMVQIAGAVAHGARVIVFDEPTSSLSEHEADQLMSLIVRLRREGVTSIYVSHRMPEIFRLCDHVTVLRDGRYVDTKPVAQVDEAAVVQMMIGRRLDEYFPHHVGGAPGAELLSVSNLASPGRFRDVSFTLRAGEVLGLAGLVGAGRSELAQALFGLDPEATGEVRISGKPVRITSPREAMRLGLGLVPEDRKRQGLVLGLSNLENATLPILPRLARFGWIRRAEARRVAESFFSRMRVRASGLDAPVASLSGGNQQKIVLAKWLAAQCRILMLDEPTRGVDVGAKAEIHGLIDELASAGHGILLISSELPELIHLSTRVIVLREGRVAGEVPRDRCRQETLMRLMAGLEDETSGRETLGTEVMA